MSTLPFSLPLIQLKYFRYNRTDLPAHAYAISAESYWALTEGPQTIMLAGECGSGKSFTAFVLLEHLVSAASMSINVYSDGVAQDSWGEPCGKSNIKGDVGGHQTRRLRKQLACRRTILESFGNAGTVSEAKSFTGRAGPGGRT